VVPGEAGEATPPLPITFRPRWARRVIYPVIGVLLAVAVGVAVLLPAGGSNGFRLADRVALVAVTLVMAYTLYRIAQVRIEASQPGLLVCNIVRIRQVAWDEVLEVRLASGDPWLVLDLSDGTALAAMGIQGSDGEFARDQARQLARLVADHSARR
jgi:hypothetical protein